MADGVDAQFLWRGGPWSRLACICCGSTLCTQIAGQHNTAFPKKRFPSSQQNRRLPWEAFLESPGSVLSHPRALPSSFPYLATRRGELMIHLLPDDPLNNWTAMYQPDSRSPALPLRLLWFGFNIYSLLVGLHAWTPGGSKTFIASPSLSLELFHPAPFPPLTSRGRLLAGHGLPALPCLSWSFYPNKQWILTPTHLSTTPGLPSPRWRFGAGHPRKVDRSWCLLFVQSQTPAPPALSPLPCISLPACLPACECSSCFHTSFRVLAVQTLCVWTPKTYLFPPSVPSALKTTLVWLSILEK